MAPTWLRRVGAVLLALVGFLLVFISVAELIEDNWWLYWFIGVLGVLSGWLAFRAWRGPTYEELLARLSPGSLEASNRPAPTVAQKVGTALGVVGFVIGSLVVLWLAFVVAVGQSLTGRSDPLVPIAILVFLGSPLVWLLVSGLRKVRNGDP